LTEASVASAASAADDAGAESKAVPVLPKQGPEGTVAYVALGHEALFENDDAANRCDVCGEIVEEDSGEGPAVPGRALYVWTSGEEIRRDEPPLCPSCAAALGLSALGRWEIEEEEG
jgi:hypothetical protein